MPVLTPAGELPSLNDPANFNPRAISALNWLVGLVAEIEGLSAADWFDVMQGLTDATAGRLMTTGAFGLGASNNMPVAGDANTVTTSGFYSVTSVQTTNIPAEVNSTGALLVYRSYSVVIQEVSRHGGQHSVFRRSSVDSGATWSAWSLVSSSVVGSVSQSAGGPTGAIIERGSNTNGDYVRFADGTQICTHVLLGSASAGVTWTFPAVFSAAPDVIGTGSSGGAARIITTSTPLTTGVSVHTWRGSDGARFESTAVLHAIGRWF